MLQRKTTLHYASKQSGQSSWAPIPSGAQGITQLDNLLMYICIYMYYNIVSPDKCVPQ